MSYTHSSAWLSPCAHYRYSLRRVWDESLPAVAFCGLNPSTADASLDDATIRKEVAFARRWGYGTLIKVNAYAWRATEPKELRLVEKPIGGADNETALVNAVEDAALFVCAWGTHIEPTREVELLSLLHGLRAQLHVLHLTKAGLPGHPLYLPGSLRPFLWKDYSK